MRPMQPHAIDADNANDSDHANNSDSDSGIISRKPTIVDL